MSRATRFLAAAAVGGLTALGVGGCGSGDSPTSGAPAADTWRQQVNQFCNDGEQEATALPLPGTVPELARDAAARAEIVATVRDSVLTLGQPADVSPTDVGAYLDDLNADIDALGRLSGAANSGADVTELAAGVDESAGQIASRLQLPDCAALANAIARTP